jgi:hypothetical protein
MSRYLFASALATCLWATESEAQGAAWRIERMDLSARVIPEQQLLKVSGDAHLRRGASGPATVVLAFGRNGMVFDSARVRGPCTVTFSSARDSLTVTFAAPLPDEAIVSFYARGSRDLGRSPITAQGAMISWGARWYPLVADSAQQFEFPGTTRITVPRAWHTLSTGALADSSITGEERTETWVARRPMARSFVAAEFIPFWTRVDSALVAVYLLPRHASRMREYAEAIPRMVEHLAKAFGPYPFPTFGIAELPRAVAPPGFGGRAEPGYFIAHTDALEHPGVNVSLFAHELTHMWFPLAVDSRPPGDDMMDEAIANYGVAVYRESVEGRERARSAIVDGSPDFSMRAYFHELRRGADEPLMTDYGVLIARAKGPMVYDMLRRRVGDSAFFGVWRDLAARGGSASLADLRRLYRERVPGDTGLATFFSQWLDRTGAPVLSPTWRSSTLTLTQVGDTYSLAVPVKVVGARRTLDTLLHVSGRSHSFVLPVGRILSVELDPRDELLLWKPRFGPPPNAPASWPRERWQGWMDDEVRWLMAGYEVASVSVAVIRDGRVSWTRSYGNAPQAGSNAYELVDSMRVSGDSTLRSLSARGDDVILRVARPREAVGMVVVARGGWGGRQLTVHVAQRVAMQEGWRELPR